MGKRALAALLSLGSWVGVGAAQLPCLAFPQNRFGPVRTIVLETEEATTSSVPHNPCRATYEFDRAGFRTLLTYEGCYPFGELWHFDTGVVVETLFEAVEVKQEAENFWVLKAGPPSPENVASGPPGPMRLPDNAPGGGPLDLQKLPPGAVLQFGEGPGKPLEDERAEVETRPSERKEIWRLYDASGLIWTREYVLDDWCYPRFLRETKWTGETLLTWYFYDQKHCLLRQVFWQPGRGEVGGLWSSEWFAYGDQGFPILRCLGLTEPRCTYFYVNEVELDAYGNWIKRRLQVCRDRGPGSQIQCEPPMLQRRTITYFR
ncbi:MAG: hypothetical protein ACK42L_00015 [Thermoanaerobaculum sp.]